MADEIFDVVDQLDRPVGRAPRGEVHTHGLRHRAVHVLVRDARGRALLQRRSLRKDLHPGVWDSSATGHVEAGEEYDAAARRELREELGWEPEGSEELRRWLRLEACVETGHEFIWVYEVRGEGPFTPHPEEIAEIRWIAPGELTAWMERSPADFAPAFRLWWSRWVAVRG
jgi:isopentenyl-diphosphate delta-isomerase type 1